MSLALATDADLRGSPADAPRDERQVAMAFGASVAVHAGLAAMVALAVGVSGIEPLAPPEAALRATLAMPAQRFAAPEPIALHPPSTRPAFTSALPPPKVLAPVPIMPPPQEVKGNAQGHLMVQVADPGEAPEPRALANLQDAYPGAVRVVPEFELEPAGVYPEAALAERRQLQVSIHTVVHADGRLEVAPGTFEDPIFRDSVRAAVAAAKAKPPEVDGKAVTGWTLLRFHYEFVGRDPADAPAR